MLKAEEKQLGALTEEEFKKLPKPEEVIKIAKGPVLKSSQSKMTVLQKLASHKCSSSRQQINPLVLISHPGSGLEQVVPY